MSLVTASPRTSRDDSSPSEKANGIAASPRVASRSIMSSSAPSGQPTMSAISEIASSKSVVAPVA